MMEAAQVNHTQGIKRKLEESECQHNGEDSSNKRFKSIAEHMYEIFFNKGEGSDVTIVALGQEFKLHKSVLCQSEYFSRMFCGGWKESDMPRIELNLPDQKIDVETIKIALGSLYTDNILIPTKKLVSVLAAACLLRLESLEKKCIETIIKRVNPSNVFLFLEVAEVYAQPEVTNACLQLLQLNLMTSSNLEFLKNISPNQMVALVSNPETFCEEEWCIYTKLKSWLFLQLTPNYSNSSQELEATSDAYWKERAKECDTEFLLLPESEKYAAVFQALRLQHMVIDQSIKVLEADMIVPKSWVTPWYRQQWLYMLEADRGDDEGPTSATPEDVFKQWCQRCGMYLTREDFDEASEEGVVWSLSNGYNYGCDLVTTIKDGWLMVRRNTLRRWASGAVCRRQQRRIQIRISVFCLDEKGNVKYFKTTGIRSFTLGRNLEVGMLELTDDGIEFPLFVGCQMLLFTPRDASMMTEDEVNGENEDGEDESDVLEQSSDEALAELAILDTLEDYMAQLD